MCAVWRKRQRTWNRHWPHSFVLYETYAHIDRHMHTHTQTHTDKKRQQNCVHRGERLMHTLPLPSPCIPMTGSHNSLLYIYLYTYIYLFISLPGVYRTFRYMGPRECYRYIDSQWIRREQEYYTSSCLGGNHQGNCSSDVYYKQQVSMPWLSICIFCTWCLLIFKCWKMMQVQLRI